MKFLFWILLSINAALFAYGRGYLGNFKGNEREPARTKNQVSADKLKVVPAAQATAAKAAEPSPAPPAPALQAVAASPALIACVEVGNLTAQEARRFDSRIAALGQLKPVRQNVTTTEVGSYMVHIAPQATRAAADSKAEELKNLGVTNYYVIPDNTPMKWAISLGVFKSENAAKTLLAALNKQGVQDARISGRGTQVTRVNYRFRDIDTATRDRLDRIAASFPGQRARSCK
nr:SPOR domain-containing protein [Massilia polaris]